MQKRGAYYEEMGPDEITFYHGTGCNLCGNTGYLKRIGAFEILPLNDEIRRLFLANAPLGDIKAQALAEGMVTMRRDAMQKVKEGITTTYEVMRNVFSIGNVQGIPCADDGDNTDQVRYDMVCRGCGSSVARGLETCPKCSEPLMGFCCSRCGRDVAYDWKLCPQCGERLDEDE